MPRQTIPPSSNGTDVAVTGGDFVFWIERGQVEFSTDAGSTWIRYEQDDQPVFSLGRTVALKNTNATEIAVVTYMGR